MKNMLLECRSIRFRSSGDERIFFEWLSSIQSIRKFYGEGFSLFIELNESVSDEDLRELIAIFFRYNIKMSQLKQFVTAENRIWFQCNKKSYWYKKVFLK